MTFEESRMLKRQGHEKLTVTVWQSDYGDFPNLAMYINVLIENGLGRIIKVAKNFSIIEYKIGWNPYFVHVY